MRPPIEGAILITPAVAVRYGTVNLFVPGEQRPTSVIHSHVNVCDGRLNTFTQDYLANHSLQRAFPGGGMGPFLFTSTLDQKDHLMMVNMIARRSAMPMDDVLVYDWESGQYTYLRWKGRFRCPYYPHLRMPRYLWPENHPLPEGTYVTY